MSDTLDTRKVMIGALEVDVLAGRYYTPEDGEGNRAAIHPETNTDVVYNPTTGKNLTTILAEAAASAASDATSKADNALTSAKTYTNEEIAKVVGGAPEALDTLNELAEALRNNPAVMDAIENSITLKADKTYVDSTFATKTALDEKANSGAMDTALGLKADKTYVDSTFATKTALSTKANASDMTDALALKADVTTVDTLNSKVDAAPKLVVGTVPFAEATGLKAQDFYVQVL